MEKPKLLKNSLLPIEKKNLFKRFCKWFENVKKLELDFCKISLWSSLLVCFLTFKLKYISFRYIQFFNYLINVWIKADLFSLIAKSWNFFFWKGSEKIVVGSCTCVEWTERSWKKFLVKISRKKNHNGKNETAVLLISEY
jgi:hypothetical protein